MTIRESGFRGKPFKFVSTDLHASWWTFEDEQSVRDAYWNIEPGDVIFDVGAAFGSYTLPALAVGAEQVYAWSPEDEEDLFAQSLQLNGWQEQVVIYRKGLWSSEGYLNPKTLQLSEDDSIPGSFLVESLDSVACKESKKKKRAWMVEKLDWIKMDVEGAEFEVLKGAKLTLEKFKPNILIENHLFIDGGIHQKCKDLILGSGLGYREVGTMPYHSVSHSLYVAR